jgi:hypothetical protein
MRAYCERTKFKTVHIDFYGGLGNSGQFSSPVGVDRMPGSLLGNGGVCSRPSAGNSLIETKEFAKPLQLL